MTTDKASFRQQFREPVDLLITRKRSQFALMMITLPLLERLLRGRSHLKDRQRLSRSFYEELLKIFPSLENVEGAKALWVCFRHGILHQATFLLKRAGDNAVFSGIIGFERLTGVAVAIRRSGDPEHIACVVDPIAFARRVLSEIENDFETFQTAEPNRHPIALIESVSGGIYSFLIPLNGL